MTAQQSSSRFGLLEQVESRRPGAFPFASGGPQVPPQPTANAGTYRQRALPRKIEVSLAL